MIYVVMTISEREHSFNFSLYEDDKKTAFSEAEKCWSNDKDLDVTVFEVNEDIEKVIPIIQANDLDKWFELLKANKPLWNNGEFMDKHSKKSFNMDNVTVHQLKCYRLLMKCGKGGEFEYEDFVRTRDPISEEKAEIRNNILNHGMDKQVAELVRVEFEKNKYKDKRFSDPMHYTDSNPVCVIIGWNEETKKATLIDIGFYK